MSTDADFLIQNHGSLWLVCPMTADATAHLEDVTGDDAQWFCGGLMVEPRYIRDVVSSLLADGFEVSTAG